MKAKKTTKSDGQRHNALVKELIARTGASVNACHQALLVTSDDLDAAAVHLSVADGEAEAMAAVHTLAAYRKGTEGVTAADAAAARKTLSAYVSRREAATRQRAKRLSRKGSV